MANPKQPPMFESLDAPSAPPGPSTARTEALDAFLLGQGIEPPPPLPPPSPLSLHADLWMLGTPTYQRKIAFTESVGARFGDLGLTSRFTLDRWSETPAGFQWTLDPAAPVVPVISPRAADLLDGCFMRTRHGLYKLAAAEYGGDLEAAIIHAIDAHMTMIGLDRFLPEAPPEEAW